MFAEVRVGTFHGSKGGRENSASWSLVEDLTIIQIWKQWTGAGNWQNWRETVEEVKSYKGLVG